MVITGVGKNRVKEKEHGNKRWRVYGNKEVR